MFTRMRSTGTSLVERLTWVGKVSPVQPLTAVPFRWRRSTVRLVPGGTRA